MTTDTIPGADVTQEALVLGVMLYDPTTVPTVRAIVRPEHFFRPEFAMIARTLFRLCDAGNYSAMAVKSAMAAEGTLSQIGRGEKTVQAGIDCLANLYENYSHDANNLIYNARCVRNGAALRDLIRLGDAMKADARRTAVHDAEDLLADYQSRLFNLDVRGDTAGGAALAGDVTAEAAGHSEKVRAGLVAPGLETGFAAVDRHLCGGFHPGDLITLAAATSAGKTAFALTIAGNVARGGKAVVFVSCEMDRRAIGYRLLAAEAGIDSYNLRRGVLDTNERTRQDAALASIRRWRLCIQDQTGTVGEIAVLARRMAAQWRCPLDLIVVDYLQLLQSTTGETRAQQVGGIAWGLKQLATTMRTPVLMLSQLNREGAKTGTLPSLYALKESGDVENHSNAVILLHRPEPRQLDTDGAAIVWCKVAKARDGMTTPWPTDDTAGIKLRFRPACTKFEPMTL